MALTVTTSNTEIDTSYDKYDITLTKDSSEDEEGNVTYTVDCTINDETKWNGLYTAVTNWIAQNCK